MTGNGRFWYNFKNVKIDGVTKHLNKKSFYLTGGSNPQLIALECLPAFTKLSSISQEELIITLYFWNYITCFILNNESIDWKLGIDIKYFLFVSLPTKFFYQVHSNSLIYQGFYTPFSWQGDLFYKLQIIYERSCIFKKLSVYKQLPNFWLACLMGNDK